MLYALTLALTASALAQAPFGVDVHLPVRGEAYAAVLAANRFLVQALGSKAVDFNSSTPHVTLYLTQWSCPQPLPPLPPHAGPDPPPSPTCLQRIQLELAGLLYSIAFGGPCSLTLSAPYPAGSFAMMNVSKSACLQRQSDVVVNGTHALSQPGQPVPPWVYSLPEPQRSEKIALVKRFGSPNIFGSFEAHVTLGWAANASAVAEAVGALSRQWRAISFEAGVLAMGAVGAHGTVRRGRDLGVFSLTQPNTAAQCGAAYADARSCAADNVTAGGCVWCDYLDHGTVCTSEWAARGDYAWPYREHCDWPGRVAPSSV